MWWEKETERLKSVRNYIKTPVISSCWLYTHDGAVRNTNFSTLLGRIRGTRIVFVASRTRRGEKKVLFIRYYIRGRMGESIKKRGRRRWRRWMSHIAAAAKRQLRYIIIVLCFFLELLKSLYTHTFYTLKSRRYYEILYFIIRSNGIFRYCDVYGVFFVKSFTRYIYNIRRVFNAIV